MQVKKEEGKSPVARRAVLGGAATVGALATAAALLPTAQPTKVVAATDVAPTPGSDSGYSLTEHVKRYYATARI